MSELLIGCGHSRDKKVSWGDSQREWKSLVTLDSDPSVKPDVVHNLDVFPYPFEDNTFEEIHAYEVLEHCGRQGDWEFFFRQFNEFYRILKPEGYFVATVPMWDSMWAWGDPGHTRLITKGSLVFLDRDQYSQLGKTAMTDYRPWLKCDFQRIAMNEEVDNFGFVLQARK
jgi:SAM-dependent methyltransferase